MLSTTLQDKIDRILASPSVHFFTKQIIMVGLNKDVVDAYGDVKLALTILEEVMHESLNNDLSE